MHQRKFIFFLIFNNNRLPFDWKNPHGFCFAFILFYIMEMNLLSLTIYGFSFAIGSHLLTTSLVDDTKNDLISFSRSVKWETNQILLLNQLIDFVEFNSIVKRFVERQNNQRKICLVFFSFAVFVSICSVFSRSTYVSFKKLFFLSFSRFVFNLSEYLQPVFMLLFSGNIIVLCIAMLSTQIEMVRVESKLKKTLTF